MKTSWQTFKPRQHQNFEKTQEDSRPIFPVKVSHSPHAGELGSSPNSPGGGNLARCQEMARPLGCAPR